MIDPTFELLWRKIAESYVQVAQNPERVVAFEHDIYHVEVGSSLERTGVVVYINDDVEVKSPTLIAP